MYMQFGVFCFFLRIKNSKVPLSIDLFLMLYQGRKIIFVWSFLRLCPSHTNVLTQSHRAPSAQLNITFFIFINRRGVWISLPLIFTLPLINKRVTNIDVDIYRLHKPICSSFNTIEINIYSLFHLILANSYLVTFPWLEAYFRGTTVM